MEIYIAICLDRHISEDIKACTTLEAAIEYAKDSVPERYKIEEQKLTDRMKQEGWLYYATYGVEGDSIRVEAGILDGVEIK